MSTEYNAVVIVFRKINELSYPAMIELATHIQECIDSDGYADDRDLANALYNKSVDVLENYEGAHDDDD